MNSTGIKLVYKKGIKEAQTELSYDYIIARKNEIIKFVQRGSQYQEPMVIS